MVQMIRFDIGDHGDLGMQQQEGAVALVGLRHQIGAVAGPGVGAADGGQHAADDHGGVAAAAFQHGGDHGGSSSLAVGAGYADAAAGGHEISQHLRPAVDLQPPAACFDHLFIVFLDCGRIDHGFAVGRDVFRPVAEIDFRAGGDQFVDEAAGHHVGAADGKSLVQHDLGDGAHADAANADKV